MIDDMCEQYKQPKLFRSIIAENLSDEYLITLFKQWSKEYAIDGIVVYVNDLRIWEKLDATRQPETHYMQSHISTQISQIRLKLRSKM